MGQDQGACFSSYFRVYATVLTLSAVAVSSFLIHSIFSEQIMMVNLLPGLRLLYTELIITSLLLPLSVVLVILISKRRQLLQCIEGKFPMVQVMGLVVNLLSIAALVAGTVLAWYAATTIDRTYQVLGNCFCSGVQHQLQGSTLLLTDSKIPFTSQPPLLDRLGLCQREGCYVTYTAVQVNITGMVLKTMPCQRVDLKTPHPDPVCLQYAAFHRLYPVLLIILPFLAIVFIPSLLYTCAWIQSSKAEGNKDSNMSDSTSWGSIAIPRKSSAPYFPDPIQHLPIGIRPSLSFPHGSPFPHLPHRSANLCGGSSLMRNMASPLMGTLKPVSCPVPPDEYLSNALPSDLTPLTAYDSSTQTPASPSNLDPHPCAMSTPVVGHPMMASDPYFGQVVSVTLNSTGSGTIRLKEREKALVGTNLASSFFPPDLLPRGKEAQ